MKPTRHIVKPNTGMWKPKGKVWFRENDDSTLGKRILSRAEQEVVKREVEETRKRDNAIKKEVDDYLD